MSDANAATVAALADQFDRDGLVILRNHFDRERLGAWRRAFQPLLDDHLAREGHRQNRGSARYYVTLPWAPPFDDPHFFEDPTILAVVERVAGSDPVMCQLATDTPLRGSEHQAIHRDTPPLFPEIGFEPPSYQLAVNFPLIDVTPAHGPVEIAPGTHRLPRAEGLAMIERGEVALVSYPMALGDVMIRDVRGLHRGTPNLTDEPRPMVVIGYSRSWYYRPEVSIKVPHAAVAGLSERGRRLLRTMPVSDAPQARATGETYQSFLH